jgi:hypothetical protein
MASTMILNICESNALFSWSSPGVRVDRKRENRKIGAKETGYMGRQLQALGNKHYIDSGKMAQHSGLCCSHSVILLVSISVS